MKCASKKCVCISCASMQGTTEKKKGVSMKCASMQGKSMLVSSEVLLTWKTFGALTREASADERVAENVPAVMRGPNPDTIVITYPHTHRLLFSWCLMEHEICFLQTEFGQVGISRLTPDLEVVHQTVLALGVCTCRKVVAEITSH